MQTTHPIPTHVITGFLGTGKTTCILNLLKQKPEHERWAILVNEFGEVGLDGSLIESLSGDAQGIVIRELPGGCMCCASGIPMQVALNLLLIKAKPDRLIIEPTGLGHPKAILAILSGEMYQGTLQLQQTLTVVNAQHFNSAKHLKHPIFQEQIEVADLLIVNKTDLASEQDLERLLDALIFASSNGAKKTKPYLLTRQGELDVSLLTQDISLKSSNKHAQASTPRHIYTHLQTHARADQASYAEQTELPECGYLMAQHQADGFISLGWRVSKALTFNLQKTLAWWATLPAMRIKALIYCDQGVVAVNLSQEQLMQHQRIQGQHKPATLPYQKIEHDAPGESRMELIFDIEKVPIKLEQDWQAVLHG